MRSTPSSRDAFSDRVTSMHETRCEMLACDANPLTDLDLTHNSALEGLSAKGCPLEALDLSRQPDLEHLTCGGRELLTLTLQGAAKLRYLTCSDAPLEQLDLAALEGLQRLTLRKCSKLRELSLQDLANLRELSLTGCRKLTTIHCSELQKQTLPALRKFFKLSKPTKDPAKMDPYTLHAFADRHNWDDGVGKLAKAIRNPNCSLATALLIYWRGRPHWLLQYERNAEAPKSVVTPAAIKLLREIEQRAAEGSYRHTAHIPWSCGDQADDPYPEIEKKRSLPEHMLELSSKDWKG